MKRGTLAPVLVCTMIATGMALPAAAERPLVQMAILLDTSGSMRGLIDQARSQLWNVVSELAMAQRYGEQPDLEVALFEYGNSRIPKENGFVRQVLPLTNDLDLVSERLFSLTTSGGSEHCGQVIAEAVDRLDWSESYDVLKIVFIAGNEPFTQGPVPYQEACRAAVDRDVVVNTIFCGRRQQGIETHWEDGALLADGVYSSIDQGVTAAHLTTPQDDEITRLGVALNATYLPYGREGADGLKRQERQDANANSAARGTAVARSQVKASPHYVSAGWDLVDALRTGLVTLEQLEARDLPEVMRSMTTAQQEAYVDDMMRQRVEIQNRIRGLSQERARFLTERQQATGGPESQTLDRAIVDAIRTQGERVDLEFETVE